MNLELIEQRLTDLERALFGSNQNIAKPGPNEAAFIDQLYQLHVALLHAEKKPNCRKMLGRINEIQKYTDPNFIYDDVLSIKSKIEIILTEQEKIKRMAEAVASIDAMQKCLDHPVYSDLSNMRQQLDALRILHADQNYEFNKLMSETQTFLENYYQLTNEMSKMFVQLNQNSIKATE